MSVTVKTILLWIVPLLVTVSWATSDSLQNQHDSLQIMGSLHKGDSLKQDTINIASQPAVGDSILYRADTIQFLLADDVIKLTGHAHIEYGAMVLDAYQININTESKILKARGKMTIVDNDTSWHSTPSLVEKADTIKGLFIAYNLDTKKGKLVMGNSKVEKGHYTGEEIAMVSKRVFNARNGSFTTCETFEDPHYHFYSKRMKLYVNDKVIAKPVILKFKAVPAAALPFFVFPIKKERHSGILIPLYGRNTRDGRYLKNAGYYFVPNDYWDFRTQLEFYEKTRTRIEARARYRKRYLFDGSIAGSYLQPQQLGGGAQQRWDLNFNHNQKISPTIQFRGNGNFVSDETYFDDFKETVTERTERKLISEISLSQRLANTSSSMLLKHTKTFLDTSTITTMSLPTLSFATSGNIGSGFKRSSTKNASNKLLWFQKIRYRYRAGFANNLDKRETDSDSLTYNRESSADHNYSLTYSNNLMRFTSISLSAIENYKYILTADSSHQGATFSSGLTLKMPLYGIFQPHIGSLVALRHVVTPTLSYNFGIGQNSFNKIYIPFRSGTKTPETSTVSLTVTNLFQAKTSKNDKEVKHELLNGPTISTSYDLKAKRLSLISTRLNRSIGFVSFALNTAHSVYEKNGTTLLFDPENKDYQLMREVSRSFSISTRLNKNGALFYPEDIRRYSDTSSPDDDTSHISLIKKKWDVAANYSIAFNKHEGATQLSKTQNLFGSLGFNLTTNWRINYQATYDFTLKDLINQRFVFQRDMHCWEGRFVWQPTGSREGFYFKVNIKELPDIKVEKEQGIRL